MSEHNEVNYFQYLPQSVGSQSAPIQSGQTDVRATQGQPQEWGEDVTPEKYQEAIAAAEEAKRVSAEAQRYVEQARMQESNARTQNAQRAWDQAAAEARTRAAEMHPDDGLQFMEQFYQSRENALKQESQSMFLNFAANTWSEKLIQDYELQPDDMVFLKGVDPNQMEPIAKRLQTERKDREAKMKELEDRIGQNEVGRYVKQRVNSGAYQTSGGSGRQPAFDPNTLSVRDHLRFAIEND